MRSFTRQLNQYSFWKGHSVDYKEGKVVAAIVYNHPNFLSGRPDLLAHIMRRPVGESPAPPPVKQLHGRLGVVSHRHVDARVDFRVADGTSKNKIREVGSIGIRKRRSKCTRQSEVASQKIGEHHTSSRAYAQDSTGSDDEVTWAAPHKLLKGNSPSECNLNDTPIKTSSDLACWYEVAADLEWTAFSNGNGGSLITLDEGSNENDTDSQYASTEDEDPAMAEMCKAVSKSDVAYVLVNETVTHVPLKRSQYA